MCVYSTYPVVDHHMDGEELVEDGWSCMEGSIYEPLLCFC